MKFSLCALGVAALAGCAPSYQPDTYATSAIQQVNKVEPAVVVGFRQVLITASGTVGAVTGGAAGGVLGSRSSAYGVDAALGAVGGSAVGSILGTTLEHTTADTTGWEYIVRKDNGEMVSVTQREETPMPLGQKVLVIGGSQARIVPDYSSPPPVAATPKPEDKPASATKTKKANVAPTSPMLVVPLSSESTYTSAPTEAQPAPVAIPAPPVEVPAPAEAPAATIVEPTTEPVAAPAAAAEAAQPTETTPETTTGPATPPDPPAASP